MAKILLIEDDQDILELMELVLRKAGHEVHSAMDGKIGLQSALSLQPDLILVDWMLPSMSGPEIVSTLKSNPQFPPTPILMVTAKSQDEDLVMGLNKGADDYITKPFSPKVLEARLNRALKQYDKNKETETLEYHNIKVDLKKHVALIDDVELTLTSSEFKTLKFLISKPGWVFNRNQIMEAVHGDGYIVSERSIDVMIVGLRKKMGEAGNLIETVRGVGYRMTE